MRQLELELELQAERGDELEFGHHEHLGTDHDHLDGDERHEQLRRHRDPARHQHVDSVGRIP